MYNVLVIIEEGEGNLSAYSPDLLGCVATGGTRAEVERNMYEAMQAHLSLMLRDGDPVPPGPSFALYVSIPRVKEGSAEETMYRVLTIIREEQGRYVVYAADTDEQIGQGATLKQVEQQAYDAVKMYSLDRLEESATYPSYAVYMSVPVAVEQKIAALSPQPPQYHILPELIPRHRQRQGKAEPAIPPAL